MAVIDEIKTKVDIVEVVSNYVSLQKAGRNFRALCPFHTEKHPSFFVFPERQSWHCFGACNTGGDVFSFLMRKENIDFGHTLRLLAERTGIALTSERKESRIDEEKAKLFEINEAAAEYYHHLLLTARSAEVVRNYLTQRGLLPRTIKNFQLGFSLDSWDSLLQYLTGKGYKIKELVAVGLIGEKENRNVYDWFRNKLMFPICNVEGRVVGFGARVLDESLPKYLNSPQTPIFDKGGIIYGIDRAKSAIRKQDLAIIVEGYMDVLMAHQNSWENVVASMGTAITEKQFNILKKLTKNLTLALDADIAGEEATRRGIEIAIETSEKRVPIITPVKKWTGGGKTTKIEYLKTPDMDVKVMKLPLGRDPDEIIKEDVSLWRALVEKAVPVLDFVVESIVSQVDVKQARSKSLAVDKLLPAVSKIGDPIKQAHYIRTLVRKLDVSEESLQKALKEYEIQEHRKLWQETERQFSSAPFIAQFSRSERFRPVEEYCLALLLQYPELRIEIEELRPEYFQYTENRELFLQWQQNPELVSLRSNLDPVLNEYVDQLLDKFSKTFPTSILENEKQRWHALNDCILRLQERWLKTLELERKELLLSEAEKSGVAGQLSKLEEQGLEVNVRLKSIFNKQKRHGHLTGGDGR